MSSAGGAVPPTPGPGPESGAQWRRPETPGHIGALQWRPGVVGLGILSAGSVVATQFMAWRFVYQEVLGGAWLMVGRHAVYLPWRGLEWLVRFGWELIDPKEILDAEDFKPVARRVEKLAETRGGGKRVDRLSTVCTRLCIAVTRSDYAPRPRHGDNLVSFLLLKTLPNDLRVALHKDMLADGTEALKAILRDKRLAELMLAGM